MPEGTLRAILREAGIDVELPGLECYAEHLVAAVRDGAVSEATVDEAVRRVLRGKFELGLFERPAGSGGKAAVAFDTTGRGTPDRRLVYGPGGSVKVEIDPDGTGTFRPARK
jgi:beta-glucosidase-like glycosyl hydrolase